MLTRPLRPPWLHLFTYRTVAAACRPSAAPTPPPPHTPSAIGTSSLPISQRGALALHTTASHHIHEEIDSQQQQDREKVQQQQKTKAMSKAHFFRNAKSTSFLDVLSVSGVAGAGGDGCVSFSRAKYIEYGPPSGGSGGPGGSIYIRAVPSQNSLTRVPSIIQAPNGGTGKGEWRSGRRGKDVTLEVPVGTIVKVWHRGVDVTEEGATGILSHQRELYEAQLLCRLGKRKRLKPIQGLLMNKDQQQDDQPAPAAAAKGEVGQGEQKQDAETQEMDEAEEEEEEGDWREQPDYAAEAEQSHERRQMLNSVWRHYPGQGGAVEGLGADATDEANLFSREEFRLAEERYAIALRKELADRRGKEAQQLELGVKSGEATEAHREKTQSKEGASAEPLFTLDLTSVTPASSPGHLLASGGSAGFGNPFFLSGGNRSPKFATRGRQGESFSLTLELKTPADLGLIGLPNAGKSSLLRALTGATRKGAQVGGWEFTTLSPNVGVMRMAASQSSGRRLIGTGSEPIMDSSVEDLPSEVREESDTSPHEPDLLASEAQYVLSDLPGLILGASSNRGLGHQFLRHAERCLALLYVVDVSPSRPDPWEDLLILKAELEGYRKGLSDKIKGVVANKCDVLGPATSSSSPQNQHGAASVLTSEVDEQRLSLDQARHKLNHLRRRVDEDHGSHLNIFPVSAMWRQGVESLAIDIEKTILEEKRREEAKRKREEKEKESREERTQGPGPAQGQFQDPGVEEGRVEE